DMLAAQTRRMLRDPRVRRLATEFACAWLHIYDFDQLGEKSERHFPTFAGLRGAMYEETIRFFTDLFQRNGSVLDILDADYTFLDEELAKHYGIPFPGSTGDSPVPHGDPPGGTRKATDLTPRAQTSGSASFTPVGGSPTGAGGRPAPPMPQSEPDLEWLRVEGVRACSRGGIAAQARTLA